MDLQDVSNLRVPDGNVRTIHDKNSRLLWGSVGYNVSFGGNATQAGTPTPDSPQPISTVTGTQTVNVTGKNLLDNKATTRTYLGVTLTKNDDGSITLNGKSTGNAQFYLNVDGVGFQGRTSHLDAGTYTINGRDSGGVKFEINYKTANGNSKYSWGVFTVAEPFDYGIYVTVTNGTTVNNLRIYPQLELGSAATTYEPYQGHGYTIDLGSIELAEVGNYQDRIYKDDGKWYIEKQVGKADLATLTWTGTPLHSTTSITDIKYTSTNTELGAIMAERYTPHIGSGMSTATGCIAVDVNAVRVNDASAPSGLAYYALATPTTAEITNGTLIAQLEVVYNWVRRHGYNAQVLGDLPISINRTALS